MFSSLTVNKLKFDTYFLSVPSVWHITHAKPSLISHWFSYIKDDSSDRHSPSILSKARSTNNYHTLAKRNVCSYFTDKITKLFLSVPHQLVYIWKYTNIFTTIISSIKMHGIKSCNSAVMYNVCIATRPFMFLFCWDLILVITFSLPICCKTPNFVFVLSADSQLCS